MIPQAESDAGLLAYEQTLAFAALRRKRLPWIYALFTLVLVGLGGAGLMARVPILTLVCWGCALFFALFAIWNWRRLQALDVRNRALLAQLHAQYGDDLPWLEVERQMAEVAKIQAETTEKG
jgi:fatty acid desaturase